MPNQNISEIQMQLNQILQQTNAEELIEHASSIFLTGNSKIKLPAEISFIGKGGYHCVFQLELPNNSKWVIRIPYQYKYIDTTKKIIALELNLSILEENNSSAKLSVNNVTRIDRLLEKFLPPTINKFLINIRINKLSASNQKQIIVLPFLQNNLSLINLNNTNTDAIIEYIIQLYLTENHNYILLDGANISNYFDVNQRIFSCDLDVLCSADSDNEDSKLHVQELSKAFINNRNPSENIKYFYQYLVKHCTITPYNKEITAICYNNVQRINNTIIRLLVLDRFINNNYSLTNKEKTKLKENLNISEGSLKQFIQLNFRIQENEPELPIYATENISLILYLKQNLFKEELSYSLLDLVNHPLNEEQIQKINDLYYLNALYIDRLSLSQLIDLAKAFKTQEFKFELFTNVDVDIQFIQNIKEKLTVISNHLYELNQINNISIKIYLNYLLTSEEISILFQCITTGANLVDCPNIDNQTKDFISKLCIQIYTELGDISNITSEIYVKINLLLYFFLSYYYEKQYNFAKIFYPLLISDKFKEFIYKNPEECCKTEFTLTDIINLYENVLNENLKTYHNDMHEFLYNKITTFLKKVLKAHRKKLLDKFQAIFNCIYDNVVVDTIIKDDLEFQIRDILQRKKRKIIDTDTTLSERESSENKKRLSLKKKKFRH